MYFIILRHQIISVFNLFFLGVSDFAVSQYDTCRIYLCRNTIHVGYICVAIRCMSDLIMSQYNTGRIYTYA